jgi:hypothetical protein
MSSSVFEGVPTGQGIAADLEDDVVQQQVQQPHRTEPTACDQYRPIDLHERPSSTFVPLDGEE